jgi:flagellar basal body rod protein FlgG
MTAVHPEYPYPWHFTKIIKTIETSANQMQPFTYQSTAYQHIERKQSAAIGIWKSRQKQHVIKRGQNLYQDSTSSKTPAGYREG